MQDKLSPKAYAELAAETPLFCGVELPAIQSLLSLPGTRVETYAKGALLNSTKACAHCIGFIVSGSAKVEKNDDNGGRILMSVLHVGEVFGAASLFSGGERYVANICAMTPTRAVLIPEDAWLTMLRSDFRIAKNYMTYLTARIRYLSSRIDGFAKPSAEERVLSFLHARAKDGVYRPETSLRAIGEALCIGRTTLYRAFDALEQSHQIIKEGRSIRLLQEEEK